MPLAEIIAAIALLLQAHAPIYAYGGSPQETLNAGIVVVMDGKWSPGVFGDGGCSVVGYESRGEPGYFFGEC